MTEDERTRLIQQINMGANLNNHQMDAVMGALTHLGWRPPKQESEMTQTDAPTRCEPPEGVKDGTWHVFEPKHADGRNNVIARYIEGLWAYADGHRLNLKWWSYSHAVNMDPPVVDPHAALRDAVVEAATTAHSHWVKAENSVGTAEELHRGQYWKARDGIWAAVEALHAATLPPTHPEQRRPRRRAAPDPLAYAFTIPDAQAMGAPGRTKIYELFKSGALKQVRVAGRTMVSGDSLRTLLGDNTP